MSYAFAADLEDPDRILGVEVWADRAALEEHMAHDHTGRFLAAVSTLLAGEPAMSSYEVPGPP